MVQIDVAATPRKHEVVEDVFFGEDGPYTFTASPIGGVLSAYLLTDDDGEARTLAIMRAKIDWLEAGFPEEDWAYLTDRVKDPEDPLNSYHLTAMYDALTEEVTNRPPTSSPRSSGTRPAKRGAAKPKLRTETSGE